MQTLNIDERAMYERISHLRGQGFTGLSVPDTLEMAKGIRLTAVWFVIILLTGLVLSNIWVLMGLMFLSLIGVFLPNHPLDYLYNYGFAKWLIASPIPRRTIQGKFANMATSLLLLLIIFCLYCQVYSITYFISFLLLTHQVALITNDFCFFSESYNLLVDGEE